MTQLGELCPKAPVHDVH